MKASILASLAGLAVAGAFAFATTTAQGAMTTQRLGTSSVDFVSHSLYADCDTMACNHSDKSGNGKGSAMQERGVAHKTYADCDTGLCDHQSGKQSGNGNGSAMQDRGVAHRTYAALANGSAYDQGSNSGTDSRSRKDSCETDAC